MLEGRILVVDDNPTNLKLICDLLDGSGYQVPKAMDAEQALDLTRRWSPDLVLRDLALPGMDGLALTRRLKGDEATRHIRIVALTASAMKGDEQKALEASCDGYLSKPIDTRRLAHQVAQALKPGTDR